MISRKSTDLMCSSKIFVYTTNVCWSPGDAKSPTTPSGLRICSRVVIQLLVKSTGNDRPILEWPVHRVALRLYSRDLERAQSCRATDPDPTVIRPQRSLCRCLPIWAVVALLVTESVEQAVVPLQCCSQVAMVPCIPACASSMPTGTTV